MPRGEPDNYDRAEWARVGVMAFADETGIGNEDMHTQIGDLLADLMHLADLEGLDWETVVRRATMHYEDEIAELGKASPSPKAWSPRQRRRKR